MVYIYNWLFKLRIFRHMLLSKDLVVTLLYIIIYEKCIIFGIAYGEMHELLTW